jgi:catechol 2,3-dioxygenase-like lactoylglutathione lyase family enzyme
MKTWTTGLARAGIAVLGAGGLAALSACAPTTGTIGVPVAAVQPHSIAMSVSDIDAITRWYEAALGFSVLNRNDNAGGGARTAVLTRDGFRLELVELDGSRTAAQWIPNLRNPAMVRGFGQFGFEVQNVDEVAERVRTAGGRIVSEPRDNLEGTRVMILADPDGNSIKIVSRIAPRPVS